MDLRGHTDPSGRLEPGHGPMRLGRCFGPVASSREVMEAHPLSTGQLVAKIRREDKALTEPAPARAGSCSRAEVDGTELLLEPLSPSIGTVVHGIDLKRPLTSITVAFLRRLWLERKVIFFRNQHLSRDEHVRFAAYFGDLGTLFGEPLVDGVSRQLEVGELVSDSLVSAGSADQWHSDASWAAKPPMASILLCKQPAPIGGDTLWADAFAMYEGLPPALKEKLQGAQCRHEGFPIHAKAKARAADSPICDVAPSCVHPALRTHPETGRTLLYVSPLFTKQVEGVSKQESDELLLQCWLSVHRPEYQCRFRWEAGSIAMWDNRSTLHYACGDWWPHTREMQRICIVDFDDSSKRPFYAPSTRLRETETERNAIPATDTWAHITHRGGSTKETDETETQGDDTGRASPETPIKKRRIITSS